MDIEPLRLLQQKIKETWKLLKLDETQQRILDLEGKMSEPDFWNNQEEAKAVSKELKELHEELNRWKSIQDDVNDNLELAEIGMKEDKNDYIIKELEQKSIELVQRFEELELYILFNGEYDSNDAIVAIHAGAGGVDAQDWTEMLLRMVTRFCEQQGWRVEIVDQSRGSEAGIKSVTLQVSGRFAYGYLKSEHGVHRLVRISPFDAEKMRHTSFALVEVIPDFGELEEIEIDENEIRIDVFRSGGHGGQSVNTTDSAVRIVHVPTGITVTCQNEKSQHQNKATAMKILKSKLHQLHLEELEKEKQELRGEYHSAEWGNQIRSYVLHPYKMVKDHRTNHEVKDPDSVLNGDLLSFMEAYLRWQRERL